MSENSASGNAGPEAIRPEVSKLHKKDVPEAARILRLAFGTFLGVPDPETFWTDRDYVYGRQAAAHVASFGATLEGKFSRLQLCHQLGKRGLLWPIDRTA